MSARLQPLEEAIFDEDDPGRRGESHGERWRSAIHELAAIRQDLLLRRGPLQSAAEVERLAHLHLGVLERDLPELHAELLGVARGAAIPPEAIVVLNHYTDLRDLPRSLVADADTDEPAPPAPAAGDEGGCTAIYIPGRDAPVLGQTWDMHASAAPFVRLLRIRPRSGDREVLCFTLVGCLGMCGVNERGVAVTINNLTCTDGQVGIVWPAQVRALLDEGTAEAARRRLMAARVGGGRHFMITDGDDFFGIECSGQRKILTQTGAGGAHLHTNHCFDPVLRKVEAVARTSTTFRRFELATSLFVMRPPRDARALWELLSSHEGHPRSLCSHVAEAEGDAARSETCGRMVMDLGRGEVLAAAGCGAINPPQHFHLERWRGDAERTSDGP